MNHDLSMILRTYDELVLQAGQPAYLIVTVIIYLLICLKFLNSHESKTY